MDVHQIIMNRDNFGRSQKLQISFLALADILNAVHMVASVFISATVDSRCSIPDSLNDTYGHIEEDAFSQYFPVKSDGKYDMCKTIDQVTNQTENCNHYVYDTSQFISTTTTEFDLVCDRLGYSTIVGVIYMAGLLAGALIFGATSDLLGRKTTVVMAIWLQGLLALGIMFSPNVFVFMVLRFFLGATCIGGLVSAFILMMEISPESLRPITAACQAWGWCIGVMLLSLLAYFIRDWRYLQLSLACLSLPYMLSYWWLLDESPSWLATKGYNKRALVILKKMKKLNKLKTLDLSLLSEEVMNINANGLDKPTNAETKISYKDMWINVFKSKILLTNVLINCFGWFALSLGYYGLSLNVGNLVGDLHVNNFVGGLVEIPAYMLLIVTVKFGRKWPYVILMSVGGVTLIISAFLLVYVKDEGYGPFIVAINMVGKFMVSAAFKLSYFWCAEMYPTQIRNSLMGQNSMSARISAMIAPAIADIPKYADVEFNRGVAPLVFGGFMVASGLMAIFLPETNKMPLPETIADANQMSMKWTGRYDRPTRNDIQQVELSSSENSKNI